MGFFGNEQVGKGAKEFFNSLDDANQTLGEISVTVSYIDLFWHNICLLHECFTDRLKIHFSKKNHI